eukprot:CAMPEP_0184013126 /NCGR_PEP_ID=MMETSP0954-20121128/4835_1 /TAXON_ID=627963 /ORGANISM="Aplanochytrium sp, Strain PBS07" /LENGTH=204 /DNA_ID=CAMNT_0026293271 /DNA_START=31 /DNA_END=645 /DNA_ORIENTATION=-
MGEADERIISALENTEEILKLRKKLDEALKCGFLELSSAKFSKGFSDAAALSSNTYPPDSEPSLMLQVDEEGQLKLSEGVQNKRSGVETVAQDLKRLDIKTNELRRRNVGKCHDSVRNVGKRHDSESVPQESKGVTPPHASKTSKEIQTEKQYLREWLGYLPNGRLEKSRVNFTNALEVSAELVTFMRNHGFCPNNKNQTSEGK